MEEDRFFDIEMEYMDLFEDGKIDEALEVIMNTWNEFLTPKVEQSLFYILVEDLIKICIKSKRYDLGNKYISLLFVSDLERVDDGQRELISGILSYEQGNLDVAKELFYIANSKSNGRIFNEKENKRYKKLLEKTKNSSDSEVEVYSKLSEESYKEIVDICKKGDKLVDAGEYDEGMKYYLSALELVPEPKKDWEATTWICAALGDVYFLMGEYDKSKNYLFDTLNCPNGMTNPFVNLRLGECFYELENIDKSKEYLIKSYMLQGYDIFEGEDDKYFKVIKDLI